MYFLIFYLLYNLFKSKETLNFLYQHYTDTGEGLSQAQQNKLFQPFEHLGKSSCDIEGMGIDLVITKNLIEKMNGRIGLALFK